MDIRDYRRIGRSEDNQETRDRLFTDLFEVNNYELYEYEKTSIIDASSIEWKEFYRDCFSSLEGGRIMIVIPSLMMAIEHELSNGKDIDKAGKKFVENTKLLTENEK